MPPKKQKVKPITMVHNFGGRRCVGAPQSVASWGTWDCDPSKQGPPTQKHAYGESFPWTFDMEEKAYIIEGTATLTADDEAKHGKPVSIGPKDMVTFPKGWIGRWDVDSFLKKRYAFFDGKGIRIDEDESDDDEETVDAPVIIKRKAEGGADSKKRPKKEEDT
jgi:uncharacterized cupin superfamily protein